MIIATIEYSVLCMDVKELTISYQTAIVLEHSKCRDMPLSDAVAYSITKRLSANHATSVYNWRTIAKEPHVRDQLLITYSVQSFSQQFLFA
jgi:hypothetical protein